MMAFEPSLPGQRSERASHRITFDRSSTGTGKQNGLANAAAKAVNGARDDRRQALRTGHTPQPTLGAFDEYP